MAEAALKKLEDQLNCLVCLDTYTDPKQLQCHHVFCRKCLVPLVVRDQEGQLTLVCPTCRQVTLVPANGVASLQSAFHINHLLEIVEEHKKATTPAVASADKAESGSASTSHKEITVCCREHAEKEVNLYCVTCEKPICLKCVIKSGKHFGHETELLGEAFECYKKEVTSSLEPIEKQLVTVKKALAQLETRCGEISDQRAAIEVNIHDTFRRFHETLDVRKTQLIGQLHQITKGKLKGLAVQRDQIETTMVQLSSCLDFVKESLKTGSEGEVLIMKTTIVKQVKELTTTFQPDILKPSTEADMAFSTLQDLTAMCQNYGHISTQGLPDPSKCYDTGKSEEIAAVREKSTDTLQAINYRGQPYEKHVVSSANAETTSTKARGTGGQYKISNQPTIRGRHQLYAELERQHISPVSAVPKLGTPLLTIGGVEEPWGVAITQRREVVVTELEGHCVSMFSPSGEKLQSFGSWGSAQGQFDYPRGVAVDGEGNILVADSENRRIQKFTAEGQFLTAASIKDGAQPWAIAYNPSNSKLYVLDANDFIQVLNSDLSYFSSFGKRGRGTGELYDTYALICDNSGNVYVANTEKHQIQVFTAEGEFLKTIGRFGDGRGELASPRGIAVDISGMVCVSDSGNYRVSIFTTEGQFVTSFGECGAGCEQGKFRYPVGLAVDSRGVIYVCDRDNNHVQAF